MKAYFASFLLRFVLAAGRACCALEAAMASSSSRSCRATKSACLSLSLCFCKAIRACRHAFRMHQSSCPDSLTLSLIKRLLTTTVPVRYDAIENRTSMTLTKGHRKQDTL